MQLYWFFTLVKLMPCLSAADARAPQKAFDEGIA